MGRPPDRLHPLEFLLERSDLNSPDVGARPPQELAARAKDILTSPEPLEAAAGAVWAIWEVLPADSDERRDVEALLLAFSPQHRDELYFRGFPGSAERVRACFEHGIPA